jgi:hypothetical protein
MASTGIPRTLLQCKVMRMEVLMKIGRYAGELRDLRPDVAKQLIERGSAEDPRMAELKRPVQVAEVAAAPVASVRTVARARRSR